MPENIQKKINLVEDYFKKNKQVVLGFLFGSYAGGRANKESDVDIGLYLKDGKESKKIESDISRILGKETDIVYFNKSPASLVSHILKTGIVLANKNQAIYWDLYLWASNEAEDFLDFSKEYWEIYQKARSLAPEQKIRLLQRIQFLQEEIAETDEMQRIDFKNYQSDKNKRRIIERWAENVLNATIDIAKIVLASEKKKMPKSYEDALFYFVLLVGFNEKQAHQFSGFAKLRNILAHEYLDITFDRIQKFISEGSIFYDKILKFLEDYTN